MHWLMHILDFRSVYPAWLWSEVAFRVWSFPGMYSLYDMGLAETYWSGK